MAIDPMCLRCGQWTGGCPEHGALTSWPPSVRVPRPLDVATMRRHLAAIDKRIASLAELLTDPHVPEIFRLEYGEEKKALEWAVGKDQL